MRFFKYSALSAFALMGLLTSGAHAGTAITAVNNQFSLSVGTHKMEYREVDRLQSSGGDFLDTEKGRLPSMLLNVARQGRVFGQENVYLAADLQTGDGTTRYNGYLQGEQGLVPYKTVSGATTTELVVRVGKSFPVGAHFQITPLVGVGTRNWVRDIQGPGGYTETYSNQYYEAGVMGQYAITPQIVASATAVTGSTFNAVMTDNMTGADRFVLGSSQRQLVKLSLDYTVTKNWHVTTTYVQSDFRFMQSPVVAGYLEPTSSTNTRQVYVGVGFSF